VDIRPAPRFLPPGVLKLWLEMGVCFESAAVFLAVSSPTFRVDGRVSQFFFLRPRSAASPSLISTPRAGDESRFNGVTLTAFRSKRRFPTRTYHTLIRFESSSAFIEGWASRCAHPSLRFRSPISVFISLSPPLSVLRCCFAEMVLRGTLYSPK